MLALSTPLCGVERANARVDRASPRSNDLFPLESGTRTPRTAGHANKSFERMFRITRIEASLRPHYANHRSTRAFCMIKPILNIVLISIFFLGGCKALCKENKKVQEKDDLLIGEDKRIVIPNDLSIKPLNTDLVMPSLYGANSNKGKALVKKNYGVHIDQKNILNRLKAEQHCNGSWGTPSCQQLSTAFALIALLRVGESKDSYFFGKTVQAAHDWLLNVRGRLKRASQGRFRTLQNGPL